jgi:hypothetical protein
MSFQYSGDPSTSNKDAVRFEIGDTNEKTQLVQDEEINYALKREGTILKAAARVAEGLAARFAREDQVRTSTFTAMRSELANHFRDLSRTLRARGIRRGNFVNPSMTRSGKRWNASDTDLIISQPFRNIHSNRAAGTADGKTDCGCENLDCGHRI